MKLNETNAIVQYLEFHLLSFVEEMEQYIENPRTIGDMYDQAYGILADFERTLEMQLALDSKKPLTRERK